MTTYTINRFQTVELPTFRAGWKDLCDRCRHRADNRKNHQNPHTSTNPRCLAVPMIRGGALSCSEVRHTSCANGELFAERQA